MTESPTPLRWGIISTGQIARTMCHDLKLLPDAEIVAVSSRDGDRAAAFASEYEIARSYDSVLALAADPEIDVVYIATPHNDHLSSAVACLAAGKAVLCEKPLTVTAAEAEEVVAAAQQHQSFLMEAMWARTNPVLIKAAELARTGALGPIRQVQAALGFRGDFADEHRMVNPDLAGGVILDMGVYPVHMAHLFLGEPDQVIGSGWHHPRTGVDIHATGILVHHATADRPAAHAVVHTSIEARPANRLEVIGETGTLVAERFLGGAELRVEINGAEVETLSFERPGYGYTPQLEEVHRCIRAGLIESPLVPWSATIECMRTLERWMTAVQETSS